MLFVLFFCRCALLVCLRLFAASRVFVCVACSLLLLVGGCCLVGCRVLKFVVVIGCCRLLVHVGVVCCFGVVCSCCMLCSCLLCRCLFFCDVLLFVVRRCLLLFSGFDVVVVVA